MRVRVLFFCITSIACDPSPAITINVTLQSAAVPAASDSTYGTPVAVVDPTAQRRACEEIAQACASAGYYVGGYVKGLGIHIDCADLIAAGKTAARVHVATSTLQQCLGADFSDKEGVRMLSEAADDFGYHDPK